MAATQAKHRPLLFRIPTGVLLSVALVVGISAVSAATALPSSLRGSALSRRTPPPQALSSFIPDDPVEDPVVATESGAAITGSGVTIAMGETDEDTATLQWAGKRFGKTSMPSDAQNVQTSYTSPLISSSDPPLARAFPQDLDAMDGGSNGEGGRPSVSLALSGNGALPHLLQGSENLKEKDARNTVSPAVFNTTVFETVPSNAIPQVVLGNGSSYQAITVNNIASTVISAVQNITTTTVVNLTQTCGDGCTLGADVAATSGSNAGQDIDGSANANTTVGQDAEAQNTETNNTVETSTQTSTGSTLP